MLPCHSIAVDSTLTFGLALGFLVTLYATLITLFGLAWVLFLIGTFKVELIGSDWS